MIHYSPFGTSAGTVFVRIIFTQGKLNKNTTKNQTITVLRHSYLGPLFSSGIKGVSNESLLGVLHAAPDKLWVDLLLHEDSRGSRAALPLVEEHTLMGTLHCQVHCNTAQEEKVLPHA